MSKWGEETSDAKGSPIVYAETLSSERRSADAYPFGAGCTQRLPPKEALHPEKPDKRDLSQVSKVLSTVISHIPTLVGCGEGVTFLRSSSLKTNHEKDPRQTPTGHLPQNTCAVALWGWHCLDTHVQSFSRPTPSESQPLHSTPHPTNQARR